MWKWKAGNKYGNKSIKKAPGQWFDSKAEAALFSLLSLEERSGRISSLSHHPGAVYLSKAKIQYRPDFRYIISASGETEHAEYKGFETSDWRIKRRLWIHYGPTKLHIWRGPISALKLEETIGPGESE